MWGWVNPLSYIKKDNKDNKINKGQLLSQQILEYYNLHKQIKSYFIEGFNNDADEKKYYLYFINSDLIKEWKMFINYDEIIKHIDDKDYLNKEIINNTNIELFPFYQNNNDDSYSIFLSKILLEVDDFECLVNKKFLDILDNSWFNTKSLEFIEVKFLKEMLLLFIEKQKRVKVFYKGEIEGKNELIQLNIDFPKNNDLHDYYFNFNYKYPKNYDLLINLLNSNKVNNSDEVNIKENTFECIVYNNNKYRKYFKNNFINSNYSLNNVDLPRTIGLQNIGATCYMNATLQCLVNIDILTRYLLQKKIFFNIINNNEKCEILSSYCFLLEKLCCDEKVVNYFNPKDFKEIISRKNPLFRGIQANDSKDLIYFLIEQMNFEFIFMGIKINNALKNNNISNSNKNDESNRDLRLNTFINDFSFRNNNIIPKLFFSIIENIIICQRCNNHKYNFQTYYSLDFPLENIYESLNPNKKDNKNININLFECFSHFNKPSVFQGDNAIYCNICRSQQNATHINEIYSLPPILIIILNRGKGNVFECNVEFPENLDIKKYIKCEKSNNNYKLFGVITHLGSSDMNGHFIAYCRHRILKKWYCYNDGNVVLCNDQANDYKKGVPYILFYKSTQGNDNILFSENSSLNKENNNSNININNNNQNLANFNNMMNMGNYQNNMNSINFNNSGMNNTMIYMNNGFNNMNMLNSNNMNNSMNNIPINYMTVNNYINMNNMNGSMNMNNMNNMNGSMNMNNMNNMNGSMNMNNMNNMLPNNMNNSNINNINNTQINIHETSNNINNMNMNNY